MKFFEWVGWYLSSIRLMWVIPVWVSIFGALFLKHKNLLWIALQLAGNISASLPQNPWIVGLILSNIGRRVRNKSNPNENFLQLPTGSIFISSMVLFSKFRTNSSFHYILNILLIWFGSIEIMLIIWYVFPNICALCDSIWAAFDVNVYESYLFAVYSSQMAKRKCISILICVFFLLAGRLEYKWMIDEFCTVCVNV